MSDLINVSLQDIHQRSKQALIQHGASTSVAEDVADAIAQAEATGNIICGLYYLDSYCTQLKTGRVDGQAEPIVTQPKPAAINVDAKYGFAQPGFKAGFESVLESARANGVCVYTVSHTHTCTALGYFTRQFANAGLIAMGFTNAPACVAPPGGNQAVLGTNPMAFSVPSRSGGIALQFDQSTTAIAITKIRMAASNGDTIPLGWGVDKDGEPTTDPDQVLNGGTLVSSGGYKGYGLGLMTEVLAAAMSGSVLSIDAAPLKTPEGPPHDLGQCYLVIDPTVFAGEQFWDAMISLGKAVDQQANARLPGTQTSYPETVEINAELWASVQKLSE